MSPRPVCHHGRRRRPRAAGGDLSHVLPEATGGDAAAWCVLVERFTARLRAVARGQELTDHDAEDVIQTTWLRLFEHIDHVREPAAVGAWLETTARRESVRVAVCAHREQPVDELAFAEAAGEADVGDDLAGAQDRAALARALAGLPTTQQRLLEMLFAEDAASYTEIARALRMPIGSIGPTRARGLACLRRDPVLIEAIRG